MKNKLILNIWMVVALVTSTKAQENMTYQRPVAAIADLVEAPLTPAISISPDKNWMALLDRGPNYGLPAFALTRIISAQAGTTFSLA
jgi:hypothetical protein